MPEQRFRARSHSNGSTATAAAAIVAARLSTRPEQPAPVPPAEFLPRSGCRQRHTPIPAGTNHPSPSS